MKSWYRKYVIPQKTGPLAKHDWVTFDFSQVDIVSYYPLFKYSSSHPLALQEVHDNIAFIYEKWPHLAFFPAPNIIKYYNDKYKQYLLKKSKCRIHFYRHRCWPRNLLNLTAISRWLYIETRSSKPTGVFRRTRKCGKAT